jgi:NAD(P)-dependent dehydrogenase (short-subunit alcohol dehydrogenase family)
MRIEGQSVVIIGGSSGMGLAIAKEAVDAGADVTIAGTRRPNWTRRGKRLPGM